MKGPERSVELGVEEFIPRSGRGTTSGSLSAEDDGGKVLELIIPDGAGARRRRFVWAPSSGIWLPQDVSQHGHQIDHLFNFILV